MRGCACVRRYVRCSLRPNRPQEVLAPGVFSWVFFVPAASLFHQAGLVGPLLLYNMNLTPNSRDFSTFCGPVGGKGTTTVIPFRRGYGFRPRGAAALTDRQKRFEGMYVQCKRTSEYPRVFAEGDTAVPLSSTRGFRVLRSVL